MALFTTKIDQEQLLLNQHYSTIAAAKQSKSQRLALEATTIMQQYQSAYALYFQNLQTIKIFQETHYPNRGDLLNFLFTAEAFKITQDNYANSNVYYRQEYADLFTSLSSLSSKIPHDSNSSLYKPLCEALLNAISLTEHFIKKTTTGCLAPEQMQQLKNEITALTNNIQKATDFATNPYDSAKSLALTGATQKMIETVAPNTIFPENRFRTGFIGFMFQLIGIGLMLACPPAAHIYPLAIFSGLNTLIGTYFMYLSIFPGYSHQETLAHTIRTSLNQISSVGFFVKQSRVETSNTDVDSSPSNRMTFSTVNNFGRI